MSCRLLPEVHRNEGFIEPLQVRKMEGIMNTVRWNIAVSPNTDQAVRMFLASQGGGRKGDLSRFIEEAVRTYIFERAVEDAKAANANPCNGRVTTDAGRPGHNVLLSALLSPHGLPDAVYRAWQKDRFDLVTSATQIDELRRASRYVKFKDVLQPHRVGTMVNNMRRSIMLDALPPLPEGIEVNDPNDAFLLAMAMALAGEADYLVTGDRRAGLLQQGSLGRTRIVTPAVFCAGAL
ncbi:hypothetical protein DFQ28_010666 [Apophysomyces sp. BC1034]|nr:hypothetical protein DFQ28_010666 [Apophysomyces sp. BC1034]